MSQVGLPETASGLSSGSQLLVVVADLSEAFNTSLLSENPTGRVSLLTVKKKLDGGSLLKKKDLLMHIS